MQQYKEISVQFKGNKIVYRRYAGLFFSLCVDASDNELAYLESIHLFVEILDHYFSNVCELDLVFNFHKVLPLLESYTAVSVQATTMPLKFCYKALKSRPQTMRSSQSFDVMLFHLQVYLILDEFLMGGEVQETSKKVKVAAC